MPIDYSKLAQQNGGAPTVDYAALAQQHGGTPVAASSQSSAPPTENGFQRGVDALTETEPADKRPGIMGKAETALSNLGAGAMSPLSLLAHPIAAGKSILKTAANPYDPDGAFGQMVQGAMKNPVGTLETLPGQMAMAGAAGEVGNAVIPRMASGLKSLAPKVANISMGAVPDPYGGNPGMAVAREGISGFSPQRVLARTKASIPEMAAEHENSLSGNNGNPPPKIDISNEVTSPFRSIRAAKTDPMTGVAMPTQLSKLNKVESYLTHEPNSFSGQPTTGMRPLNQVSPLQANKLKSNIYGMTDYDSPFRSSLANDALKQSAHGIKNKIAEAVPESMESGERLHNLMSLKDLMQGKSPTGFPISKNAILENIGRKAGTSAAGKIYRIGGGLPSFQNLVPGATLLSGEKKGDTSR